MVLLLNKANSQYINLSKFSTPNLANINSIGKDSQGFIWCTSQSGLYKFDGKSIKKIPFGESSNSLSINGASSNLFFDAIKKVSISFYPKQGFGIVNNINEISFSQLLSLEGYDTRISPIEIDRLKHEYFVVNKNGAYLFSLLRDFSSSLYKAKMHKFIPIQNVIAATKLDEYRFSAISFDGKLSVYEINENGEVYKNGEINLTFINSLSEVYCFCFSNGYFIVGTNHGCFKIGTNGDLISKYIIEQAVYAVCPMYDNTIYLAGSKGLYLVDNHLNISKVQCSKLFYDESFLSTVYDIYSDGNEVWLASQQGLAKFDHRGSPFLSITTNGKFNPNYIYQINADKNKNIILSSENGIYSFLALNRLVGIDNDETYFLSMVTPDGRQMSSTVSKTYVFDGLTRVSIEKKYPEFKGLEGLSFNDYEYIDGYRVVLSTENEKGVYLWDFKKKTVNRLELLLGQPVVISQTNNLYQNAQSVYILTDNEFYIYKNGVLKRQALKDNYKSFGFLFDMLRIKDNFFFASYNNGIIETDSAFNFIKKYDVKSGLSSNEVYRLYSVGDSVLLVTSNNGLNAIKLQNGEIKVFTEEEGIHNNQFEEFSSYESDGKLYLGGKNGFTVTMPSKMIFDLNFENNLQFLNCSIVDDIGEKNEYDITDVQRIVIPNNTTQVTITFRNVIFPNSARIKYAYKIREFGNNWFELNATDFITLPQVNPGIYHLIVRTANEDGIWSDSKELILSFKPKWYQTWWFRIAVGLSVLGLLYLLYRYRIAQIKKQHEIRKSIATDLHDDLGSTLNSVKIFTNLAISGVKQEESLQQVKSNLNEATMGLRDMIWVLDDSMDTVDELVSRLKLFAIPVTGASGMELDIKAENEANGRKLTKDEKRNLFLICKEAINNSVKYSQASKIEVAIKPLNKKIQIIIADNGKGFEQETVKKGYGLKNMQYRAEQVKYAVVFTSKLGNGTQITIKPI